jgi:hypothetical protein
MLTLVFAIVFLTGLAVLDTSAQTRGTRQIRRPVIIRQYYVRPDPFWYWDYYDRGYYYDPYLEVRRQQSYLERELRGNQEELRKHLQKYRADGVITAKEREELEDDYRDIERARRNLNQFYRFYRRY